MKITLKTWAFLFALALIVPLSVSAQDDLYYQPQDDYYTTPNYNTNNQATDNTGDTYVTNQYNYYDGEEDNVAYNNDNRSDYSYSSRIRRFNRSYNGFGYYDPCYVDSYWYDRSPAAWGSTIYSSPYAYVPTNRYIINYRNARYSGASYAWGSPYNRSWSSWNRPNRWRWNSFGWGGWNSYRNTTGYGSSFGSGFNNFNNPYCPTNYISNNIYNNNYSSGSNSSSSNTNTYSGPRSGRGSYGGTVVSNRSGKAGGAKVSTEAERPGTTQRDRPTYTQSYNHRSGANAPKNSSANVYSGNRGGKTTTKAGNRSSVNTNATGKANKPKRSKAKKFFSGFFSKSNNTGNSSYSRSNRSSKKSYRNSGRSTSKSYRSSSKSSSRSSSSKRPGASRRK